MLKSDQRLEISEQDAKIMLVYITVTHRPQECQKNDKRLLIGCLLHNVQPPEQYKTSYTCIQK